jgi:catechol 2,3-dioxygenase-like lactoylglutathione lyase family enzyme
MGTLRFDHVGIVVGDLDAVAAFFAGLGFECQDPMTVEGETVDRINGLDGVRARVVMARTPDGTGTLELVEYHAPASGERPQPLPPNRLGLRHICIEIDDVDGTVERLRGDGYAPVGEVRDYGTSYRLVYVRGPEGLIVELAERLAPGGRARWVIPRVRTPG